MKTEQEIREQIDILERRIKTLEIESKCKDNDIGELMERAVIDRIILKNRGSINALKWVLDEMS